MSASESYRVMSFTDCPVCGLVETAAPGPCSACLREVHGDA